jgi:hypothetical protein
MHLTSIYTSFILALPLIARSAPVARSVARSDGTDNTFKGLNDPRSTPVPPFDSTPAAGSDGPDNTFKGLNDPRLTPAGSDGADIRSTWCLDEGSQRCYTSG